MTRNSFNLEEGPGRNCIEEQSNDSIQGELWVMLWNFRLKQLRFLGIDQALPWTKSKQFAIAVAAAVAVAVERMMGNLFDSSLKGHIVWNNLLLMLLSFLQRGGQWGWNWIIVPVHPSIYWVMLWRFEFEYICCCCYCCKGIDETKPLSEIVLWIGWWGEGEY